MAFDGIFTAAVAHELAQLLTLGKIEKVYQPEADELVFLVHTKQGNKKLYMSCASGHAGVYMTERNFENPAQPMALCMLLRKHLQSARIAAVRQHESERIIEIEFETQNELGFSMCKKLIVEIMGKHSNICLVDDKSGKIIDCLKHVSIDVNRVRQLLPGKVYVYPPAQDKVPFWEAGAADFARILDGENMQGKGGEDVLAKKMLSAIGGISPAVARFLAGKALEGGAFAASGALDAMRESVENGEFTPLVFLDENDAPVDFHILNFPEMAGCKAQNFETAGACAEYYFMHKAGNARMHQKSADLRHSLKGTLEKLYLKKQKLSEELSKAENSDHYRLYGELLNANLHLVEPGADSVTVTSYYDGSQVTIPLDKRFSGPRNAQNYFKKYGKAKTAIHEKKLQILENDMDIEYLESALVMADNAESTEAVEEIREELVQQGYLRRRKNSFAPKKGKAKPMEYHVSGGYRVLVGRNNLENDRLTFKMAGSRDIFMHTKDIHGSHLILFTEGKTAEEVGEEAIYEAASIAAYYSKARESENVPVDYMPVKLVKKPAGARPGMVIFTGNRTVWVNPGLPK